jgi:hypothetical protein
LNLHPGKDNPESPLWIPIRVKNKIIPYRYQSLRTLVKRIACRAGIKKRIYPHLFRHTRVTHLLMDKQLNEAQAKIYFGWVPESSMLSDYSHLISSDVNDTILEIHGIKTESEKEDELKPKQCSKCNAINPKEAMFCCRCTAIMDVNTAVRLDEKRQEADKIVAGLLKNPDISNAIMKTLQKSGLGDKLVNL